MKSTIILLVLVVIVTWCYGNVIRHRSDKRNALLKKRIACNPYFRLCIGRRKDYKVLLIQVKRKNLTKKTVLCFCSDK